MIERYNLLFNDGSRNGYTRDIKMKAITQRLKYMLLCIGSWKTIRL